jgi:hypothetical protein
VKAEGASSVSQMQMIWGAACIMFLGPLSTKRLYVDPELSC